MNISILLMEQIIQLFLMIFMGYLIVKVGLVKDEDSKVLSKIILYLIIPCVIINAFLKMSFGNLCARATDASNFL